MKKVPARWLALATILLALVCIFACSDDESCPTCPTVPVCHDPSKALLGEWIIFKSTVNGSPDLSYLDTTWDFLVNDRLVIESSTIYNWAANDSLIYMIYLPNPSLLWAFSYNFVADTLNMRSKVFTESVYWKLLRT